MSESPRLVAVINPEAFHCARRKRVERSEGAKERNGF
jgi:hypothetical protein